MPWNKAVKDGKVILANLAGKLGKDENDDPGYASKLLYHIRETLDMLDGAKDIDENVLDMLVADYMGSGLLDGKGLSQGEKKETANKLLDPLLEQCRVFENKNEDAGLSADAALLLRFLAQKGVER